MTGPILPTMGVPDFVTALFPDRMFHVGIVVDDLTQAKITFSALTGASWRPVLNGKSLLTVDGHSREISVAAVYSDQGPVHLELIQQEADSPWTVDGLHHLGFWSADVDRDCSTLTARGAVLEARMRQDGLTLAAYLRVGSTRIELNDIGGRERIIGDHSGSG